MMLGGCHAALVGDTDRDVYRLIDERQRAALGAASDVRIDTETDANPTSERMYRFNPRPVGNEIPEAFQTPRPVAQPGGSGDRAPEAPGQPEGAASEIFPAIFPDEVIDQVQVFGLREALSYAMGHARALQSAKEDLYLAALDLTLERHLWTPQFVAEAQADVRYADAGGLRDEERTFTALSDLSVSQRLPYGGEVAARVVGTLVRDLNEHVAFGESGSAILEADIPLLRGAGRVAYESRYAAERELIYAVRTYERFRRTFLVDVAAEYFNLQRLKAAIANTYKSYQSRKQAWEKADFINRMGRSPTIFDAPRAKSSLRESEAALVSAKEQYQFALDRFKIFIGMPVQTRLDVLDQEADEASRSLDRLRPAVSEDLALETALKYRLDLLNRVDAVDDAKRGVVIARNQILLDLDLTTDWAVNSDPEHLNTADLSVERYEWNAGLQLRLDDRKAERNAYRASFIALRQAERQHEEFEDTVRSEVRRAIRVIEQQTSLREIQALNVEENDFRRAAAQAQFDLGKSTNQDVVDADNDLLSARNELANAVAAYRVAILNFRRDTDTLRFSYDGELMTGPNEPPAGD